MCFTVSETLPHSDMQITIIISCTSRNQKQLFKMFVCSQAFLVHAGVDAEKQKTLTEAQTLHSPPQQPLHSATRSKRARRLSHSCVVTLVSAKFRSTIVTHECNQQNMLGRDTINIKPLLKEYKRSVAMSILGTNRHDNCICLFVLRTRHRL